MKHEISEEKLNDFFPCGICGENSPRVENIYRGYRGVWLFIVKCDCCGEFEPFKVVWVSDQNINNTAIDVWNKKIGRAAS